jgi:hypothetical protein
MVTICSIDIGVEHLSIIVIATITKKIEKNGISYEIILVMLK